MTSSLTPSPAAALPRVTLVISFRERWSLTIGVIEAIARNTPQPYKLWMLDAGMPPALRTALNDRRAEWGLDVITLPPGLWPNQARSHIARQVDTPYVVFIDNDVLVQPGWLEALLACADETGAGIVGPLYLWGEDASSDLIHMAGGELSIVPEDGKCVMVERHRLINKRLGEVEAPLRREACGFAEFHCMLMRREVLQAPDTFDPGIVCVHEHIHASLVARQLGYATWMEPAARVFYLARSPWRVGELLGLRRRWSSQAAERSLRRFAERWNVIDDARSFAGVRGFAKNHVASVDPLRMALQDPARAQSLMSRAELEQTPAGLVTQAMQRGYPPRELDALGKTCQIAMRLSDGGYRACGRPFLNHLVGTASVLVHYGFELRLVLTALLHAAYSHADATDATQQSAMALQTAQLLGGVGSPLERGVRAYTLRKRRLRSLQSSPASPPALALRIADAELLLLEAANDIDMHLSLEVATTGRHDLPDDGLVDMMVGACQSLAVPGMGQTLLEARRNPMPAHPLAFHPQPGSFRFVDHGTAPMVPQVKDPRRADQSAPPPGERHTARLKVSP